jgi:hypothetical protein
MLGSGEQAALGRGGAGEATAATPEDEREPHRDDRPQQRSHDVDPIPAEVGTEHHLPCACVADLTPGE